MRGEELVRFASRIERLKQSRGTRPEQVTVAVELISTEMLIEDL